MNITKRLTELKDADYQVFQSRIIPNIPAESILGIRVPMLRTIAKEFFSDPAKEQFLQELPHRYYEENIVHIMLVCMEKDFQTCVEELERFLPFADNWAVTDQPTPKCFKKKHKELEPVLRRWLASEHVYTARFAVVMYMHEFLEEDFDERYPALIAAKQGDNYYLKMVIAWYFATALAKQYDAIIPYFEKRVLPTWTHNKAIQKACESFRVTEEHKTYLKTLKHRDGGYVTF